MSVSSRVDGGVVAADVEVDAEHGHAVVVGQHLAQEFTNSELDGGVGSNGCEDGVVGIVEPDEEVLDDFVLFHGTPCRCELVGDLPYCDKVLSMVLPSFLVLAIRVQDWATSINVITVQTVAIVFMPMKEIMMSLVREFNK
jgi:hypothetical protein